MKKIILILGIGLALGLASGIEATYTKEAIIYNCDPETSIVYCIDAQGHSWSYQGEGLEGQKVKLTIYDNHTSTITDDIIKEVELCLN